MKFKIKVDQDTNGVESLHIGTMNDEHMVQVPEKPIEHRPDTVVAATRTS
jgi:hypothetical protein